MGKFVAVLDEPEVVDEPVLDDDGKVVVVVDEVVDDEDEVVDGDVVDDEDEVVDDEDEVVDVEDEVVLGVDVDTLSLKKVIVFESSILCCVLLNVADAPREYIIGSDVDVAEKV